MDRKTESKQRAIANASGCAKPGQRAEDEAPGDGCKRSAPVAVHPWIGRAKLNHRQHAAEQRPFWRRPATQHPIAKRAHRAGRQQNAGPWQTDDRAPERQHHAVSQRINGRIRGRLQNEEGFKELMQRMCGIGEAEVSQGVGDQQVPELVVHSGRWHRMIRQHRETERNRKQREQQHAPPGFWRQFARARQEEWPRDNSAYEQQRGYGEFEKIARAEDGHCSLLR